MITLSEEQIVDNYARFLKIIEDSFDEERAEKLLHMYEQFGERLYTDPASSFGHFHLACVGGYMQHILNIIDTSKDVMELFEKTGGTIDFTEEERIFAAMHHDLGKLGSEDEPYYIVEDSQWHRKNQGRIYKLNPALKNIVTVDRTFFLLQKYGITYTENEMLGIRLADGVFDSLNEPYYKVFPADKQFRTNIQHVIHWADWMVTRAEGDEWKRNEKESAQKMKDAFKPKTKEDIVKPKAKPVKTFEELFGN